MDELGLNSRTVASDLPPQRLVQSKCDFSDLRWPPRPGGGVVAQKSIHRRANHQHCESPRLECRCRSCAANTGSHRRRLYRWKGKYGGLVLLRRSHVFVPFRALPTARAFSNDILHLRSGRWVLAHSPEARSAAQTATKKIRFPTKFAIGHSPGGGVSSFAIMLRLLQILRPWRRTQAAASRGASSIDSGNGAGHRLGQGTTKLSSGSSTARKLGR